MRRDNSSYLISLPLLLQAISSSCFFPELFQTIFHLSHAFLQNLPSGTHLSPACCSFSYLLSVSFLWKLFPICFWALYRLLLAVPPAVPLDTLHLCHCFCKLYLAWALQVSFICLLAVIPFVFCYFLYLCFTFVSPFISQAIFYLSLCFSRLSPVCTSAIPSNLPSI